MSKAQELAFSQALASVSLETKALTSEIISLLRQAITDQKTLGEILYLLENTHITHN
jgi:hypothetical protein